MSRAWRHEWRLFLRAPGTLALLVVLAVLAVLGAANGARLVFEQRAVVAAAVAADARSFHNKRAALIELEAGRAQEGQFGSARKAHQAILNAQRPLAPVESAVPALSAGVRATPSLLQVSTLTRHVDQQPRLDDPANHIDGAFDLLFVATWLMPLFALVLGCDVLAGDRERGSAALLASQGTSLGRILRRRLGVRFLALFAVVGLPALLAAIVTSRQASSTAAGLAVWGIALAVYLAFWFACAALVNTSARSAATAALTLLCCWIAFSVAIPSVAGGVVHTLAPPPDRLHGVLQLRDIEADLNRRRREVTAAYYAARPQNTPVQQGDEYEHYFVTELYPRHRAFDLAYGPVATELDAARVHQARALRRAALLSPPLAFRLLTEEVSGGAPERRVHFLAEVDAWQHRWREHFDHKLASMRPLEPGDYDTRPEFAATDETASSRGTRLAGLMLALLLPALIAILLGSRRARRTTPLGVA